MPDPSFSDLTQQARSRTTKRGIVLASRPIRVSLNSYPVDAAETSGAAPKRFCGLDDERLGAGNREDGRACDGIGSHGCAR